MNEAYAQVGVVFKLGGPVGIQDPPAGVDFSNGLQIGGPFPISPVILAQEARSIIESSGTFGTTADIHAFFVPTSLLSGTTTFPLGVAVTRRYYGQSGPQGRYNADGYLYNVFVSAVSESLVLAHEIGHLLTDDDHVTSGHNASYNLMWPIANTSTSVDARKRLTGAQEILIHSADHSNAP